MLLFNVTTLSLHTVCFYCFYGCCMFLRVFVWFYEFLYGSMGFYVLTSRYCMFIVVVKVSLVVSLGFLFG